MKKKQSKKQTILYITGLTLSLLVVAGFLYQTITNLYYPDTVSLFDAIRQDSILWNFLGLIPIAMLSALISYGLVTLITPRSKYKVVSIALIGGAIFYTGMFTYFIISSFN